MKNSAYPLSIDNSFYMAYLLPFLQEKILSPP